MHTTTRKPGSVATRRLTRRAYDARQAERAFALSVFSLEMTPQLANRMEAAKARAEQARNAEFLDQYRCVA